MKYLFLLITIAIASAFYSPVHAYTDFKCESDCVAKGYDWGLCNSRCSYEVEPAPVVYIPPPLTTAQKIYDCIDYCTTKYYLKECTRVCKKRFNLNYRY